jgi:hypothetical protein
MAQKLIWKQANSNSGIAFPGVGNAHADSGPTPFNPALEKSPMTRPPSANARL